MTPMPMMPNLTFLLMLPPGDERPNDSWREHGRAKMSLARKPDYNRNSRFGKRRRALAFPAK
jgi:hypothetical protein